MPKAIKLMNKTYHLVNQDGVKIIATPIPGPDEPMTFEKETKLRMRTLIVAADTPCDDFPDNKLVMKYDADNGYPSITVGSNTWTVEPIPGVRASRPRKNKISSSEDVTLNVTKVETTAEATA